MIFGFLSVRPNAFSAMMNPKFSEAEESGRLQQAIVSFTAALRP